MRLAWREQDRAGILRCSTGQGKSLCQTDGLLAAFRGSNPRLLCPQAHRQTHQLGGDDSIQRVHRSQYLDESNDPLFPFGFGLSYTEFTYSDLKVITPKVKKDESLKVSALITNTGKFAGTEVVQLYVQDLVGMVTRPVKQLMVFKRVTLNPGENCVVEFDLPANKLTFLDLDLKPVLETGEYKVWVARDSSTGLEGQFELV
jgi:hypothetical protein